MATKTADELRAIVRKLIMEHASHKPSNGDFETEAIIDDEKGHYQLLRMGWQGECRVHGSVVHIDIKGDRIWIQHDRTYYGVATELVEAGITPQSIVLGFHPEHVRRHTGFAVR